MQITAHHNLSSDELRMTIVAMTKSAHLEQEVFDSLEKSLADGPRQPSDPTTLFLVEQFNSLYVQAQADIHRYVADILSGDLTDLVKAEPADIYTAGPLTDQQVRSIQQAIRDRFNYIAATMESDFRPDDLTLKRWKKLGVVDQSVTAASFSSSVPESAKLIRNAFIFGRFNLAIEKGARSYEEILKIALEAPLLKPEQFAVGIAEKQAASYITTFGDKLAADAGAMVSKRNRQIVHDMVVAFHKQELKATKLNDFSKDTIVTTWREFSSELYHTFDDKSRDWQRLGYYEIYDSKRYGEGLALLAKYGPEQLVYKMPLATACPQCKALYLTDKGHPRLYRLAEMLSWGNNIGRKPMPTKGGVVVDTERLDGAETYRAVAGLIHPWCQCPGPFPFTGMEWWAED